MSIFDTFTDEEKPKSLLCPVCGIEMKENYVRKEGRNKGRKFAACPEMTHFDKSFVWLDTPIQKHESMPVVAAPVKIMSWTPQQQAYFDAASSTEESIVLRANAGTGKTTTNTENTARIRECNPIARIANVSFGRDIASVIKEKLAQRGLYDIDASTIHSMCYKAVLNDARLNKPKVEDRKTSFILRNITDSMPQEMAQNIQDVGGNILHLVALCKCTMSDPTTDNLIALSNKFGINFNDIEPEAINVAKRVFEISTSDFSTIDFNDMVWLVASGMVTTVPYDFIIVDEEQDLNRMQQQALIKFSHEKTRFMGAGDPDQCVIGDTKIMCANNKQLDAKDIKQGDNILVASGNGNIKEVLVNNVFKKHVDNIDVVEVKTLSGKVVTTTPEHIHFAGFRNDQIENYSKHFVYLMYKENLGFRIGKTSYVRSGDNKKKTLGYKVRSTGEHADAMWILGSFESDGDARYFEQYISVKYGIPTWVFYSKGRNIAYTQEHINKLFANINTKENVLRLFRDFNLFISYPHHVPKSLTKRRRRNFSITMFSDSRSDHCPIHSGVISGSDENDKRLLEKIGIKTHPENDRKGWRARFHSANLGNIYSICDNIKKVIDINIIQKASLLRNFALPFMPAGNLLPNMNIFVEENGKIIVDTIIEVNRKKYTGYVVDLNIDRFHNYIANGVVTHNSIFAWSGADINAYFDFINMVNARVLPLSVTFRCPKSHVEMSRQFLSEEGAKLFVAADSAPEGTIETIDKSQLLSRVSPKDFIICRNNAPLVLPAFELIRNGVKATILGRDIGKGLVSLVERFEHKKSITDIPTLCNVLDEYAYTECDKLIKCMRALQAATLRDQVDTIFAVSEECTTIPEIKSRITSIFDDNAPGVTLSSVHRIKGKEADNVFILRPDLFFPEWGNPDEEKHVAYVAHTRSKDKMIFVEGK